MLTNAAATAGVQEFPSPWKQVPGMSRIIIPDLP